MRLGQDEKSAYLLSWPLNDRLPASVVRLKLDDGGLLDVVEAEVSQFALLGNDRVVFYRRHGVVVDDAHTASYSPDSGEVLAVTTGNQQRSVIKKLSYTAGSFVGPIKTSSMDAALR
jgi:predicted GNAT family acetyltransferase